MGNAGSCLAPGGRQLLNHASAGNSAAVRDLLEDKPELANFTFFGSRLNVVHHAASKGHVDVLISVVETLKTTAKDKIGVDTGEFKDTTLVTLTWHRFLKDVLNATTSTGETALMLACQHGHVDCATYLLENGADIFAIDKHLRRSAVHYAAAGNKATVLKRLLDENTKVHTDEGLQPLRDVRVHDMSGQCRYIDSRAENGMTALHLAAAFAELETLQVLLAAGASMMVRTVDLDMSSSLNVAAGSTPLHLAAQRGSVSLVQAMLQAHADAMGTLGAVRGQRRAWEGDGRIDLRSVANCNRQLPYHVAWQRGYRQAAGILNPTVAIDNALETVRELDQGYGPQKLVTLAAYAMRLGLLQWLEQYKVDRQQEVAALKRKRVIYEQQRKKALDFHSIASVDQAVQQESQQYTVPGDGGHLARLAAMEAAAQASADPLSEQRSSGLSGPLSPQRRATTPGREEAYSLSQDTQMLPSEIVAASRASLASPFEALASDAVADGLTSRGSRHKRGRSVHFGGDALAGHPEYADAYVEPSERSSRSHRHTHSGAFSVLGSGSFTQGINMQRSMHTGGGELPPLHIESQGNTAVDPTPASLSNLLPRMPSGYLQRTLSSFKRSGRQPSLTGRVDSATNVDLWRTASVHGFTDATMGQDDLECGICLEDPVEVGLGPCRHRLCLPCATKLCEFHKKPPLCPFCRCTIGAFLPEPVRLPPSQGPSHSRSTSVEGLPPQVPLRPITAP